MAAARTKPTPPATKAEETPTTGEIHQAEVEQAPILEKVEHATLADALAGFQAELPTIRKASKAEIETRGGGSYNYSYADLTDVSAAVLPVLARHGLAWSTGLDTRDDGQVVVKWRLRHGASGEKDKGTIAVGRPGGRWQDLGSAITYARRYALTAATGVAPGGDDNDAGTAGDTPRRGSSAQQPPREDGQARIEERVEYLPQGLYDPSTLVTSALAMEMYNEARAARHLHLYIKAVDEAGVEQDVRFGDWLAQHGKALKEREEQDAEADAVAAHEAELAAEAGGPASPEDGA